MILIFTGLRNWTRYKTLITPSSPTSLHSWFNLLKALGQPGRPGLLEHSSTLLFSRATDRSSRRTDFHRSTHLTSQLFALQDYCRSIDFRFSLPYHTVKASCFVLYTSRKHVAPATPHYDQGTARRGSLEIRTAHEIPNTDQGTPRPSSFPADAPATSAHQAYLRMAFHWPHA
jgi:hypothetical protein